MKETLKISVDKNVVSSLKRKKHINKYIESLLLQEVKKNKLIGLLNKLDKGFNLGGFNREELYGRT